MNIRKSFLALTATLFCLAPSTRLRGETRQTPQVKCEDAIARKLKAAENLKKVSFLNNTRRSIPHGPLTHYAGKGFYAVPGGGRAEFEWFCDVTEASGTPENLYYEVSQPDAATPAATKEEVVADVSPVSACQSAVAYEIKKKNSETSNLAFSPPKEFQASKAGKLLEGDGSFKDKQGQEMKFGYRCIYDKLNGKITAQSFQLK